MKNIKALCGIFIFMAGVMSQVVTCEGAVWEGTDDFSGPLAKWDTNYIHVNNPSDGFFLSSGHLQLIKTVTTTDYSGSGAVIWPHSLPFSTNWTLMADTHLNSTPQFTDQDVRLDLYLYSTNPTSPGAIRFRIGVVTSLLGNTITIEGPDPTNVIGTDITLGITYDSATKRVTSFYFPVGDAASLVIVESTNVSAWPEMRPVLYGLSEYWAVDYGEVWLDNFRVYGTAASPNVALVKAVSPSFSNLILGRSYSLQVSSDLTNWFSQGTPFTATNFNMVYPQYWDVDNWGSLFFRLQVTP